MSDFLIYDEGANHINDAGITGTVYFLLSTKAVGTEEAGQHKKADTLAGGVGEITGTSYARKSQVTPASAARAKKYAQMIWETLANVNWQNAKSVVMCSTADNSGFAYCAWNLQTGGAQRPLGEANVEEKFTPTYTL